jgi:Tat protein secretion system quality control protein TatD with DNase activity
MAEPPPVIDVHYHLAAPEFDTDRAEVIDRAREAGVVAAIAMGEVFSLPATVIVSEQQQKLARALPLESLLLESDAPAQGPEVLSARVSGLSCRGVGGGASRACGRGRSG